MDKVTDNAQTALEARYFLRDDNGDVVETVPQLWDRVAKAIAAVEEESERQYWFEEFRALLASTEEKGSDFLPNTPTIMNAGLPKGQLSACFVLPVEDSIEGIYETLKITAKIHQSGGGTGFSGARLRPKGAIVDSKQGVASGPDSFFSVFNASTEIMKQGGKRKGANMYIQRVDHPDILEFIDMKMTPGVMTNFNVSVAITDKFLEALKNDGEYELFHTKVGVTGKLRARDVWDKIASNAHRSAEPGLVFIDRINQKRGYHELIEATNPCGEQPLPAWGSCNLGSINLSNFVENTTGVPFFNWGRFYYVVEVATRFLDNVIDANHYPHPHLEAHAKRYRNIGLGGMGLADALIKLRIPYGSEKAIAWSKNLQYKMNLVAHQTSFDLALEKGVPTGAPFPTYFDYSDRYRRNATLTTWAPTGSLSLLANCSSGCEPNFSLDDFEKHILDRVLVVRHPVVALARAEGWWHESFFIDAHQVTPIMHVRMQAALQEHCDSAISKTINLPKAATVADVQDAYDEAILTGCKGITVYRDGSREGVLHKIEETAVADTCCESPKIVVESGCETCKSCGTSKCLIA